MDPETQHMIWVAFLLAQYAKNQIDALLIARFQAGVSRALNQQNQRS